jgi:hypothetical protein
MNYRLIQRDVNQGKLLELQVSRRGPRVSHLLSADDILLFMKIDAEQANVIRRCYVAMISVRASS